MPSFLFVESVFVDYMISLFGRYITEVLASFLFILMMIINFFEVNEFMVVYERALF